MLKWEDEIHRKVLDQISHLHSSLMARKITSQAYRIGIESISATVSGVISEESLTDCIAEAIAESTMFPDEPVVEVFRQPQTGRADAVVVMMRQDDHVRVIRAKDVSIAGYLYQSFDETQDMVDKVKLTLAARGFAKVTMNGPVVPTSG